MSSFLNDLNENGVNRDIFKTRSKQLELFNCSLRSTYVYTKLPSHTSHALFLNLPRSDRLRLVGPIYIPLLESIVSKSELFPYVLDLGTITTKIRHICAPYIVIAINITYSKSNFPISSR